jgi:DNA-binding response OmpR family regulator
MNVVVFGLEDEISHQLESALTSTGAIVAAEPASSPEECIHAIAGNRSHVVFCGLNLDAIRTVRERCPSAAIIVVSRVAEVEDWLDALEAGADDYYAAPLDGTQVQWMLQSMASR